MRCQLWLDVLWFRLSGPEPVKLDLLSQSLEPFNETIKIVNAHIIFIVITEPGVGAPKMNRSIFSDLRLQSPRLEGVLSTEGSFGSAFPFHR